MNSLSLRQVGRLSRLALQQHSRQLSDVTSVDPDTEASPHLTGQRPDGGRSTLFRTQEIDPSKHTIRHQGLFYTIQEDETKRWLKQGQSPHFYKQAKAFRETSLMVRAPAVEVMECMKAADYRLPALRYILYGDNGCGKTSTLMHLLHFCGRQNWLIMHIPWAVALNRYSKVVRPSIYKEGQIDQPKEAAQWLADFKNVNGSILKTNEELKTKHAYVWSKREETEVGTSLWNLIEFGLTRPKFSCDVFGALVKELKLLSSEGSCRFLVAIDGVNALWQSTQMKRIGDRGKRYAPEELTMVNHLKKLICNDWSGGAVVATVDKLANTHYVDASSYLPRYLLQKEGFDFLDPFVPIHVPDFNEKEAISCLHYYADKKWITHPKALSHEGQQEMMFLSSCNPMALYQASINW